MLLHLIGISFARDIFEVLDHMTDMWIFTTTSRAFSSSSSTRVHEPESQRELKVHEQEGQRESLLIVHEALSGSFILLQRNLTFFLRLLRKPNGI